MSKKKLPSADVVDVSPKGQDAPCEHPAPAGVPVTLIQRNDGWCFHFGIVVDKVVVEVLPVLSDKQTEDEAISEASDKARLLAESKGGYADYTGIFKKINFKE